MIRLLCFIVLLVLVAAGFAWLADRPGDLAVTFGGRQYETSLVVAATAVLGLGLVIAVLLALLRGFLRMPATLTRKSAERRRRKGTAALSRGMIAAGGGDIRATQRAAAEASRHLGEEPMTLLLKAQAAQLAGDRATAEATFAQMAKRDDTKVLGLRGLHGEARRRGDAAAAHRYAELAHRVAPVAWAGHAVLDHHAASGDWNRALAAVETNFAQRLIDKPTEARQRAVLQTAIAQDLGDRNADEALRLARESIALAPDLVPAAVLAAGLLARRSDIRRATRLVEGVWKQMPHPDLARAYLDIRPGDSALDRLARAQALARLASGDPESRLVVARAALDARDFTLARATMAPLVEAGAAVRPTVRACLMMADIEEVEHGASGLLREWLSRASHAPRDKAWVADEVASDVWAPVSPVTGKLDAYRWQTPAERLSTVWEPPEERESAVLAPPARLTETPVVVAPTTVSVPVEGAPASLGSSPAVAAIPSPVPGATAAEPVDAVGKLAAIRTASRQAPHPVVDVFPIATAPDDPGPEKL